LVVTTDICPEFTPWVVGNLYDEHYETLLKGRVPINAGFLVMKPGIDIGPYFYDATQSVDYDYDWQSEHIASGSPASDDAISQRRRNTNFIDEQGCLNVAIYKSDIPFVIMPRDVNIYGHEVFDRLEHGVDVELCHFISGTKRIFLDFEHQFFTKLYDKFYSVSDFKQDICAPGDTSEMGLVHLSDEQVSRILYPDESFDEFQDWVPANGHIPDPRDMDWTGRGLKSAEVKSLDRKKYPHGYYDPEIIEYPTYGDGLYGMRVIRATQKVGEWVNVETTGAYFHFSRTGVDISQKINVLHNGEFPQGAVPSARLTFSDMVDAPIVPSISDDSAFVSVGKMQFLIHSDSFVQFATTLPIYTYSYENLLNSQWTKGYAESKMWNTGQGGHIHGGRSLHAFFHSDDRLDINIPFNGKGFFSVFPSKRFDFDKLYGENSRPHTWFIYRYSQLDDTRAIWDRLEDDKFGVICLFASYYTNNSIPVFNEDTQRYEHIYQDPQAIHAFIHDAHQRGYKVIGYASSRLKSQPWSVTFDWMKQFRSEYNLDGWFFDNANMGGAWDETYEFVKNVRREVGDDGVLFHHDSVDIWGLWNGNVFSPVDSYMDYTLKGETGVLAKVDVPHHPYLKYYSQGYGLSQAIATHKLRSDGSALLERGDLMRALGQNYNGTQRATFWSLDNWEENYRPFYLHRKNLYNDVPYYFTPNPSNVTWWSPIGDLTTALNGNQITLSWSTFVPMDSTVKWTFNNDYREHEKNSHDFVSNHSVTVFVESGKTYKFFIRCGSADHLWWFTQGSQFEVTT